MADGTERTAAEALGSGRAFVELRSWRAAAVTGSDATRWLHDLLTADVASLALGASRRSLFLTPTGRIRADVHVLRRPEGFLLLQRRDQPEAIDEALERYRLSADVRLDDANLVVFAVPGGAPGRLEGTGSPLSLPSVLGDGVDVIVEPRAPSRVRDDLLVLGLAEATEEAAEVLRILRGDPRLGTDFDQGALPAETGLEAAIDTTKGCFLGQESVAKIRNLGHPPRVLRRVIAEGPVAVGDAVVVADALVGEVTSAVAAQGPSAALVRVRWDARNGPWALQDGRPLRAVPQAT